MTITVRTSEKLYEWIKTQADKNKRSLGGQIEWLLEQLHEAEAKADKPRR